MKDRDIWNELKDEMREMFIYGYNLPEDTPNKYMNEAYGIVFERICELDGTNEFSNILHDMNRSE
ncbi:hypothetical protein [Mammaliicoccus fleurettii]|uniref:hypothetical protein n=1 Tax=Mammaliicoccus fleurettii TaxID=150056 RepID=UPI002DBAD73C|nr:hypothetical protein [Mammaliicoccus fleurettii]MEB7723410.1 hypothetical protein [Mammaliicoccus fleurettii]